MGLTWMICCCCHCHLERGGRSIQFAAFFSSWRPGLVELASPSSPSPSSQLECTPQDLSSLRHRAKSSGKGLFSEETAQQLLKLQDMVTELQRQVKEETNKREEAVGKFNEVSGSNFGSSGNKIYMYVDKSLGVNLTVCGVGINR